MTEHFGECTMCGGSVERPFWDSICFDCQDEIEHEEDLDDVDSPDEDFYIAPHEGRG